MTVFQWVLESRKSIQKGLHMITSGWESLHPDVQKIVLERKWTPTPIQTAAMNALLNNEDALLVAPTGSGKTESAILPIVSNISIEIAH